MADSRAWSENIGLPKVDMAAHSRIILRFAGKVGNPLQTKQGNRSTGHDQKGRRGSDEVVPGPSVFPSREPGVSGVDIVVIGERVEHLTD